MGGELIHEVAYLQDTTVYHPSNTSLLVLQWHVASLSYSTCYIIVLIIIQIRINHNTFAIILRFLKTSVVRVYI